MSWSFSGHCLLNWEVSGFRYVICHGSLISLSLEKVGIHDRFFELGGNSLVGIRIVGQMKKMFDRKFQAKRRKSGKGRN
ncbi:MAG: hypothetical protein DRI57_11055 [Deltaproteobacteria bacterium]|nr:MAG: hypothetical protein DRI57_11055 [Deltaproteobacteria bacterium]